MTGGVIAHHPTDGGVDGRQDFQAIGFNVMVGSMVHQSSDGASLGAEIRAILFNPDSGADETVKLET
ncbi:hypothetical protein HAX54_053148, partial [Datura stramonium]|nr:hypothetical protein [Datura stramonium]